MKKSYQFGDDESNEFGADVSSINTSSKNRITGAGMIGQKANFTLLPNLINPQSNTSQPDARQQIVFTSPKKKNIVRRVLEFLYILKRT